MNKKYSVMNIRAELKIQIEWWYIVVESLQWHTTENTVDVQRRLSTSHGEVTFLLKKWPTVRK